MPRLLAVLAILPRGRASAAEGKKNTRLHWFIVISAMLVSFASGSVLAHAWQDYYGPGGTSGIESNSMTNMVVATGAICQVCHRDSSGGSSWNAYGWAIRQALSGSDLVSAFISVEMLDSDGNGNVNLVEIMGDAQPGWTNGENICIGLNGSPLPCDPPAGILLDALDTDNDGDPNVIDLDDDNDGLTDEEELVLGIDPLDPDSDDDGIGDALDVALGNPNNFCIGTDTNVFNELMVGGPLTCAATTSITVSPILGSLVEVLATGNLHLIAPTIGFRSGFRVLEGGQLTVISKTPCPGCSP